jgi:hypothetical protein
MPSSYEEQRERIVESFEQNKLELKAAVQDLTAGMRDRVQEVRARIDIRHRIGDRPGPWLAGGFALGLFLGTREWLTRRLRLAGF